MTGDLILVATGRGANVDDLGLRGHRRRLHAEGDRDRRHAPHLASPHIYAVGDVAGYWQLAHTAFREGEVAAENIAGHHVEMSGAVPRCIYTDPEIAAVGLTEAQAREQYGDDNVVTGQFPYAAIARAAMYADRTGFVKTIHETTYGELLGLVRRRHQRHRARQRRRRSASTPRRPSRRSATRSPRTRRSPRASRRRRWWRSAGRSTSRRRGRKVARLMRATRFLMPTLRDAPADAQAISHQLLVRAGFVRQIGAGLYSYLPLGWRVHRKVEQIIREEMDAIGGQEMLMPVLHPAELWKRTGRYGIPELFKLKDRVGRDLVLSMTHEEIIALPRRRGDPLVPRPAADLVPHPDQGAGRAAPAGRRPAHARVHHEGLVHARPRPGRARRGLRPPRDRLRPHLQPRPGIRFYKVDSDVGMMGGFGAHEYMAPSPAGEDRVALCDGCDYASNVEMAVSVPRAGDAAAGRAGRGGAHAGRRHHRRRWPSSSASTRA